MKLSPKEELDRPVVGQPAPSIILTDTDGKPWQLEDQRGSNVVLIFHRHIH